MTVQELYDKSNNINEYELYIDSLDLEYQKFIITHSMKNLYNVQYWKEDDWQYILYRDRKQHFNFAVHTYRIVPDNLL